MQRGDDSKGSFLLSKPTKISFYRLEIPGILLGCPALLEVALKIAQKSLPLFSALNEYPISRYAKTLVGGVPQTARNAQEMSLIGCCCWSCRHRFQHNELCKVNPWDLCFLPAVPATLSNATCCLLRCCQMPPIDFWDARPLKFS